MMLVVPNSSKTPVCRRIVTVFVTPVSVIDESGKEKHISTVIVELQYTFGIILLARCKV